MEPDRNEIMNNLCAIRGSQQGSAVIAYLSYTINQLRIENDTIPSDRLSHNQGKIAAYSQLKEYIERGIPNTPK